MGLVRLTDIQIAEFREAFELVDKDHDGKITPEELGAVLRSMGRSTTDAELPELVSVLDSDGSGQIEYAEFLALTSANTVDDSPDLMEAYRVQDKNGDGLISPEEFKYVTVQLGEKFSDEEVARWVTEADVNGDGQINYEEFVRAHLA
ncbi:hypothetical protein GPA10_37035 [Streptomyces sp. p1417]|uniref:EF-hand domain-containing protein n=1 Tax=Streptomyces typhae TaxID=2681492 RepID=A0A6L6X952_9ACTN|nr:EF-hand domain-containing protein [Streptomyces typhae]MVO90211.1 hypothetical protein [Streptomyces typhae]